MNISISLYEELRHGKLKFVDDWTKVAHYQPLVDRAQCKVSAYCQAYANNSAFFGLWAIVFAPAVASTSGRMHAKFLRLDFLHAHREAEAYVKQVANDVAATLEPNFEDDFFKSKRAALSNALNVQDDSDPRQGNSMLSDMPEARSFLAVDFVCRIYHEPSK
jgi:hypothetical protein